MDVSAFLEDINQNIINKTDKNAIKNKIDQLQVSNCSKDRASVLMELKTQIDADQTDEALKTLSLITPSTCTKTPTANATATATDLTPVAAIAEAEPVATSISDDKIPAVPAEIKDIAKYKPEYQKFSYKGSSTVTLKLDRIIQILLMSKIKLGIDKTDELIKTLHKIVFDKDAEKQERINKALEGRTFSNNAILAGGTRRRQHRRRKNRKTKCRKRRRH